VLLLQVFMAGVLLFTSCRAACYKPPQLTAEDLDWDGTENGGEGGRNSFSMDGLAEVGPAMQLVSIKQRCSLKHG
jgi:hypothetical protein